jgi:septin family protein
LAPIYTHLAFHNNTIPEDPSAGDSSNSQGKVVEPTLKRQRNTAASARFRAKKKRTEQMQAQSARDREEAINKLENRVTELETENRWLKDLLIDKAEKTARKDSSAIDNERKGAEHKDGVGTSSQ